MFKIDISQKKVKKRTLQKVGFASCWTTVGLVVIWQHIQPSMLHSY